MDFAVAANGRNDGPHRSMSEAGRISAVGRSQQAGFSAHAKCCGTAFGELGSTTSTDLAPKSALAMSNDVQQTYLQVDELHHRL